MNPEISVTVFADRGCILSVTDIGDGSNCVVVRFGGRYATNAVCVHMTIAQAEELRVQLGQVTQAMQEAKAEEAAAAAGA